MSEGAGGYLRTALGAVGIGWAPILVTLSGAEPVPVAFWRLGYALPVLAALVLLRPSARASLRARGWIPIAAFAGLLFAADLVLWHHSIGLVGAGPSTLLANTHVVWITLFGLVWLRERPRPLFYALLPALFGGMWLLVGGRAEGIPLESGRGLLFGAGAGLAYGGALIAIRAAQRGRRSVPESVLFVQIGVGLCALAPFALLGPDPLLGLGAVPHAWLALLGIGVQVVSWWAITSGIRRLPGHVGALLLFAQPTTSLLLGWAVLDQTLDPLRVLGAATVLATIITIALTSRR